MATIRTLRRSAAHLAADRICDAFVKASIAGEELPFPNYSSVFASDVVTEDRIREAHARGRAAVIVDEHERVTVLPAPDPSIAERESERFWAELRGES